MNVVKCFFLYYSAIKISGRLFHASLPISFSINGDQLFPVFNIFILHSLAVKHCAPYMRSAHKLAYGIIPKMYDDDLCEYNIQIGTYI